MMDPCQGTRPADRWCAQQGEPVMSFQAPRGHLNEGRWPWEFSTKMGLFPWDFPFEMGDVHPHCVQWKFFHDLFAMGIFRDFSMAIGFSICLYENILSSTCFQWNVTWFSIRNHEKNHWIGWRKNLQETIVFTCFYH